MDTPRIFDQDPISQEYSQVGRPDRDCPGGSERLAIIAISPDTIK